MGIYNDPVRKEVYDLINEANPTLTTAVSATNCLLGTPVIIPGAIYPASNTTIVVTPAGGSTDFVGRKPLKYRRRDLTKLFRGISVRVAKYASKGMDSAAGVVFTVHELIADINRLYGLNLSGDDLENDNIVRGSTLEGGVYTTTVVVTVKPASLGYVGSFSLKWVNAKQQLNEMITVTDLPGRLWPGGNIFDGNHKPIYNSATYGADISSSNWWTYHAGYNGNAFDRMLIPSAAAPWGSIMRNKIIPLIKQITGDEKWKFDTTSNYTTEAGQLNGMDFAVYELPSTKYPQGNERFFTWVMVIYIPEDCPWACGELVLHYNKQ